MAEQRLIDVNALMKDINESLSEMTNIGVSVDGDWLWGKLNDAIEHAPTIEKCKTGKWNRRKGMYEVGFKCSECNAFSIAETPYCSFCGAKMVQEGEKHDKG